MTPAIISESTEKAIERMEDYMNRARENGDYQITDEGIVVTIPTLMLNYLEAWTRIVRGDKRAEFDAVNEDSGEHRIGEGVIGKAAECACRIAGPAIPLEKTTGEFEIDLTIYDEMSEEDCYDCDLNDSVTVKTSGKWTEGLGHTSWMAAQGDLIRSAPEGKKVILCKYLDVNKFLIMGWVHATDLRGKWNDSIVIKTKKSVYYRGGHFDYRGRTVKVYGEGVDSVMHNITEPEEVASHASCTA